jgi:hypothetical protein
VIFVRALWSSFEPLFDPAAILALSNTGYRNCHISSISITQRVFLTQEPNKILHNNIQLCSRKPVAQYSFKAIIMSNHIHHRGTTEHTVYTLRGKVVPSLRLYKTCLILKIIL